MNEGSSILEIKGIGEKTAKLFNKCGIFTIGDLLAYYPRSYETFAAPVNIRTASMRDFAAVKAVIMQVPSVRYVKKLQITDTLVRDEEGSQLRLSWFNMPYLKNTLKPGMQYVFRGQISKKGSIPSMTQPQMFKEADYKEKESSLQAVYALTKGLTVKAVQNAVSEAFKAGVFPEETLPEDLRQDFSLLPLKDAVEIIHCPKDKETLIPARRRLVFEEFYRFILNVRRMKQLNEAEPNRFCLEDRQEVSEFIERLPFHLTGAQERVYEEIRRDFRGPFVGNRLIQGDVGSGKTIVAFLCMYQAALCGYQSALMAPTEVLARQHYENFRKMSENYGLDLKIDLLTGSMKASEKKPVYERIGTHQTDIIVGTHALIQEKAHYEDLALVITDEQHRFGVNQRKALSDKGMTPHVLVMSATPIPRTLALILYGDLSVSIMDELPANRLPIKNALVDIDYRSKAYKFIGDQVREGRQAYVICPLVEASEASEGENVADYTVKVRKALGSDIRVEYLHGRMKNEEKDELMQAFSRNEIQVLVSTTVIEVGIDVPNASVIMIENAERFGLAQLHQLRGRVGRGKHQSYCILVDTTNSEESKKRLQVLKQSNDGFFIANEDLRMRGPGDFFGIRQSGELAFRLADIYTDADILKQAEQAAERTAMQEFRGMMNPVL